MSTIPQKGSREVGRIYADYNSTTPVCDEAATAIANSLKDDWGNPNSDYELGQRAKSQIKVAENRVSDLINGNHGKVIFTSGGTEANNMVILGLVGAAGRNAHVVTTNVEHPAIAKPLQHLKNQLNLEVTEVNVLPYDSLSDRISSAIKNNTVLVSVMAANNETGVLMPLDEIGLQIGALNEERKKAGNLRPVIFHSDAAQIIGKEIFDVAKLNLDCATIVGHKFYGPRIGALWTRVDIPPILFGGGSPDRPGTANTPMIVGLGMAALVAATHLTTNRDTMQLAKSYLEDKLEEDLPVKVVVNCGDLPRLPNTCNVSFVVPGTGKEILGRCKKVLASVSAACHSNQSQASEVLINSGVSPNLAKTAIRLSFGRNANFKMMDEIVEDLRQALECS